MKPVESKTVLIGDVEFIVRNDNLALSLMLDIHNDSDNEAVKSIKWFYCLSKAGAIFKGEEFKYTYEEFFNFLNIYGTESLSAFNKVLERSGGDKKK
jgi:hypothetical protein